MACSLSNIDDEVSTKMGFCEHCAGQRFDRAQVLRALRAARRKLPRRERSSQADEALAAAIQAVRSLEIPHIEYFDEVTGDEVLH
jgi:imidazolonepropionase-like amidohydrolase